MGLFNWIAKAFGDEALRDDDRPEESRVIGHGRDFYVTERGRNAGGWNSWEAERSRSANDELIVVNDNNTETHYTRTTGREGAILYEATKAFRNSPYDPCLEARPGYKELYEAAIGDLGRDSPPNWV